MKQILKTLIIMLFLSSESGSPAAAQTEKPGFSGDKPLISRKKSKPVYPGGKNYEVVILEVDFPKVAAKFSSLYPAAQSPLWIKEGKSLFVYFQNRGYKVSAVFSQDGNMNYDITHLTASGIPENIRRKLQASYSSSSIFNVKQIKTANDMIYEIVLEGPGEYILLHTDEEEILSTDKIGKSGNS
jgi:hypothetical protein